MPISTLHLDLPRDEATKIVTADNQPQEVHIQNCESALGRDIYVGGDSSVTNENGMHVFARSTLILNIRPGDELWAYQDEAGSHEISVIQIQKRD